MKLYYFLAVILSLIQPQIGWVFLPAILVAFFVARRETDDAAFVFAFTTGVLADLFGGTNLGSASVWLLVEALVVQKLGASFRSSVRLTLLVGIVSAVLFQLIVRSWLRF